MGGIDLDLHGHLDISTHKTAFNDALVDRSRLAKGCYTSQTCSCIQIQNLWIYIYIYLVLCPKLTLIQPTWSAYPYHLVFPIWYRYSLVFLIWYPYALFPYMVIQPIVLGMALLWTLHCPKDRYCDVTMIWQLLFYGVRADVSETLDNAKARRLHR